MKRIKIRRFGALTLLAVAPLSTGVALGGPVTGYAVFGGHEVFIGQSSTINGVVASNGDVGVDPFSTLSGLTGGGSLNGNSLGDFTVNGAVTFNGSVTTGQFATIKGAINSGGDVNVGTGATTQAITATGNVVEGQSATTTGNVAAGGDFSNGVFGVNGNVAANFNVTVNGTVNGSVTYGTDLTVGTSGAIHGPTIHGPTIVNPVSYTATSLPPINQFTAGGANVTSGGTATTPLAPGTYGALNIGTFGELYLTAGTYYFTSFNFAGNAIHFLNVSDTSKVNIFVTGNVFEDTFSNVTVNGLTYSQANLTNPSLASDILLETLGSYSQNSLGSVNFFGTIFAPNGNVTIGQFSKLTGQVIAGVDANIGVNFNQTFVPLTTFPVPEPGSLAMTAIGAGIVLIVARRRGRASRARPTSPQGTN